MTPLDDLLRRWRLTPDGPPTVTRTGHVLPVRRDGEALMLKLSADEDERAAGRLLAWWNGGGAAQVFARDGQALLMERAEGNRSLSDMAWNGQDDEACRILCTTAARLHAPRPAPYPGLVPLARWFDALGPAAATHGGVLVRCEANVRALLAEPRDVRSLHGDLHHGNVLDFAARGWLAIDPKGLRGERGFDLAPLFGNPDMADPEHAVATSPERFARRLAVVSAAAGLERTRLLHWVLAWAGLSAAWSLEDETSPAVALRMAGLAAAELDR
ncbi:MAG: aminoglycoside phosphotransferase family protein [Janthinobacterium lividum]